MLHFSIPKCSTKKGLESNFFADNVSKNHIDIFVISKAVMSSRAGLCKNELLSLAYLLKHSNIKSVCKVPCIIDKNDEINAL